MFEDLVYSLTCSDLADVSLGIHAERLVARSTLYGHLAASTPLALIAPNQTELGWGFGQQVGEVFANGDGASLSAYIICLKQTLNKHAEQSSRARGICLNNYSARVVSAYYFRLMQK